MPGTETLEVFLRGNIEQFQSKLKEAGAEADKTGTSLTQKMGKIGGAIALGIGAAAVGFGALSVKAAMSEETAHAQLLVALKNTNQGWAANKTVVEAADKAGEKYGYTSAQTETQLGRLITVTGSSTKARDLLNTAENIAAKYGVDLGSAVSAVGSAYEGNTKKLKALLVDVPIATGNALAQAKADAGLVKAKENLTAVQEKIASGQLKGVAASDALKKADEGVYAAALKSTAAHNAGSIALDALNKTSKHAADEGAKTLAGQMKTLKAEFEDTAAKVGQKLIPILKGMLGGVRDVIEYLSSHHSVLVALGVVVGTTLVVAFTAWAVSAASAAVATIAAAAPVLAIIAAVLLIAAAILFVWTHWNQIWNWIKGHPAYAAIIAILAWPIAAFVLIIGGLKFLWDNWHQIWDWIKQATSDAVDAVKSAAQGVIDFFSNLPGNILNALTSLPGLLVDSGNRLLHGLIDGIKSAGGDLLGTLWGVVLGIGGAFSGAANWLVDAGTNLIHGLWNGIKNATGWLWDKLKGFAKGLVNDVLGFFGIGSPSKVFAEVGGHLMSGLAKGIQDGAQGVHATLAGVLVPMKGHSFALAGSVSGGTRTAGSGARSGSAAPGGNNYSIAVTVAPGGNPRETGRQMVEAIVAFERGSGSGWRNN
jgi:phage-related protein